MIRTLPLQFQANTVTEVLFNQFDPHSPPATVLLNNPGDYWIYLTNIKQWIPPNTPNASYRWNGDMYAEVHTDLTPNNQFGFVSGTNQSTEACTITWSNDPTVNPTGAANQFKVVQYPPVLIGTFNSVADGTQHAYGPFQVPASAQSIIIVWKSDTLNNPPAIPNQLIVASADGEIFWGGFNLTNTGPNSGAALSDSVLQVAIATAVSDSIEVLNNENAFPQTYFVLASNIPIAMSATISQADISIPVTENQPSTPDAFGTDVTVTTVASTPLPANATRAVLMIQNTGGSVARIGFGFTPTATSGLRLLPNQSFFWSMPWVTTQNIQAITESGTTTLQIQEHVQE